ncbi:MAG: AmmeMemoRadiSam system protein A [Acidobacteria bacterium]|nr:MAG: AmmeMemoRadiSam system protein A [Acidobacteriota bacterium]
MPPLIEEDRKTLLRVARQALEEGVCGVTELKELPHPAPALMEPRGAFVTLRKHGDLRGCIGHVQTSAPLYTTVQECAVAAALADPRFPPVMPDEAPLLHMEISVLTTPKDIAPDRIVLGEHGLIITRGWRRGLLLPQVPITWNWNREQFLEETCFKAGLPADAWKKGARIEAFTAEIFEEPPESPVHSPSQDRVPHITTH